MKSNVTIQVCYLNENLQICLLALAHRHPENVVDINEAIFGVQPLGAKGWSALDIIELFQCTNPTILQAKARIVLDQQETSIYLTDKSEEIPALVLHCRGKIPPYLGNMLIRQKQREKNRSQYVISIAPRVATPVGNAAPTKG